MKETEVGLVPVDWEIKNLEKICQLKRGSVDPTEIPETPYVSLGHIDSGDPQLHQWGSSTEVKSRKRTFQPGDVLYAKLRPYLDKAVLAEIEGVCSTDILVLKAKPKQTTSGFLVNLLHTRRFLEYAISTTSGTNLPRTRWSSLRDYNVALPPLPEQRRIAGALRTIQEAIAAQEGVIAAARELKRSLMARLFTYGPGPVPAPTKETEIGEIPEHWGVTRLEKITEKPKYGYTQSASEEPIGPKFLRITDITESGVNWATVPYCECEKSDLEKYQLAEDDILFARTGATTGKSHLIENTPVDAVFASYLIRVRAKKGIVPAYLYAFFNTGAYWRQIGQSKSGSAQAGVNASRLSNLVVPLAPQRDQERIAHILSTVDAKIAAEEQRKAALEELFRSALEQLMTGQIRLHPTNVKPQGHPATKQP